MLDSALYVVDLKTFRRMGAGDILRQHYQSLSADPGSLANLDQDLPNNLQDRLPIVRWPRRSPYARADLAPSTHLTNLGFGAKLGAQMKDLPSRKPLVRPTRYLPEAARSPNPVRRSLQQPAHA